MFSLFGKHSSREAVILLHIGSASVSAGLADLSGKKPALVYTDREPLPYREKLDFPHLMKATEMRIEALLSRVIHEGSPKFKSYSGLSPSIRAIVVVLASPWYVSRTNVLSMEKEVVVTEDFVKSLVMSSRDAFEKEVEQGALPQIGVDAEFLEEVLIHVELNGYRTLTPYGKKAHTVRIAVLFTLFSKQLRDSFSKIFQKVLHEVTISWNSLGLTLYSLIHDLFPEEHTFLIMDIDGEVTDVSLVKKGVLLESISFPCGKYSVLRCLGDEAGPAEARVSILAHGAEGDSGVTKAREEWIKQYTLALEELREHNAIPHRLFLSGNEDVLPWFEGVLKNYEGKEGVFTKPQSIVSLQKGIIEPFVDLREGAQYEASLAMLLLYIHKRKASFQL